MQIQWKKPVSGAFTTAADWAGGVAPGASDDADLTAAGAAFTVTAAGAISVQGLVTSANATLTLAAGATFTASNGSDGGVEAGRLILDNGSRFVFGGDLDNNGQARVLAGAGQTGLLVSAGGGTLSGAGQVVLADNPNAVITAATTATTLVNLDNTIAGGGVIGGGGLLLANEAEGVIEASGVNGLAIQGAAGQTVVNAGLMEAIGGGGLTLEGGVFANTGTIENLGTGPLTLARATVRDGNGVLLGGGALVLEFATISGGALAVGTGDTLAVTTGADGDVSATSLANQGAIEVANDAYLVIGGSVLNDGAIRLLGEGLQSSLYIAAAGATLTGGGQVTLSDNPFNVVTSAGGAAKLANVDNTISGAGLIGANPANGGAALGVVNETAGVIEQQGLDALTLENASRGSMVNAGLIEATGAGGLVLQRGTFANTGLIENTGAGEIQLVNATLNDAGGGRIAGGSGDLVLDNATVTGGALTIGAGETMIADALTVDDVSGAALDNAGLVEMLNSSFLVVQGAVTNTGTVRLESVLNETAFYIAPSGATLSGGGMIALGDNPNNAVTAELPGVATLVNVDNTLAGSGVIGRDISDTADYLAIVNETRGVIDSTGAIGLTIDAAAPGQMTNAGLIETTGAGGLTLLGGLFTNTGTILAAGPGGVIVSDATVNDAGGGVLSGGAAPLVLQASTVTGGSFAVTSTESLAVTGAAVSDVSGASFANAGTVSLGDGSDLRVQGTVANSGVILLAGATTATALSIGGGGATLIGGGQVMLSDSLYGAITSAPGTAATLVNLDNTIGGAGTIGADGAVGGATLTFVNGASGLVQASGYNALVLNATATSIVNSGTLEASGLGGLTIEGGTLAGTGGVILAGAEARVTISGATASGQALDTAAGGTIALANGSSVTAQGACLDAGTLLVGAGALTLSGATVSEGTTGSIAVLAGATLVLASATIAGGALTASVRAHLLATGGANLLDGRAATVTNAATLTVSGGSSLEVEGAITNNGKLVLAGKAGATEMIVQAAGATLTGKGVVGLADSVFSEITGVSASALLVNVQNTIAGSGLLGGGSLTLVNRSKGVIDAAGARVALTINTGAATIANAGLIEATGAAGGLVASAIANTGVLEAAGGDLTIEAAVTGAGSAVIAAGTLSFGSAFGENVGFTGASGELVLAQSQAYGGQISGFSTSGGTSLDLEDIAFGGATKASYAGSTSSGVLTVTDGVHTAAISLLGNYTASSFEVGSDGRGGTTVVDPKAPAAIQAFAAAAAIMDASAASAAPLGAAAIGKTPTLANPVG